MFSPLFHERNSIIILPADTNLETKLLNSIKIYGNKKAVEEIMRLVNKYLSIWESLGFVQMPRERWIKIHLKFGWESKVFAIKPRVYFLDINSKRFVNKIFDEMQHLGRLKYIVNHIFFSFLVFVVQKIATNRERKVWVMVDIWKLNDLVIFDAYSLLFQSEIINNIQRYINLGVLDAALFFYQ